MAAKKDIQVLIGGKIYTLSGYESEEYLQKIALYINNKMEEMDRFQITGGLAWTCRRRCWS